MAQETQDMAPAALVCHQGAAEGRPVCRSGSKQNAGTGRIEARAKGGEEIILKDLLESGLVKDEHQIKIVFPSVITDRNYVQISNWCQDHILNFMDWQIWAVKFYENTQTWVVNLKSDWGDEPCS